MKSIDGSKRLLPCTVIPNGLYVERDADRQLLANLSTMGRPAYILVARQMGKTNLLLHAKHVVDDGDNKVVYVDLSIGFGDERDCFRRIVDCALQTCRTDAGDAEETIEANRSVGRPPSREHDFELRTLLRRLKGKLVIVLDEIDSLTNTDFSDRVFAHIRSVYFARATFQELSRLTYVLSGVVEPSEIIKDKKISPFNIGEKIYLDDFTEAEVRTFLKQAGLDLSDQEIERLLYWTSGNPRMTWDLCAEIEAALPSSDNDGIQVIDSCVTRLYLNGFDHAPVDHIRELVRDQADIRSAVWEIVLGDPTKVTDLMRTKLYLAGIVKSAAQSTALTLKNEVIKRALSPEWLREILYEHNTLLRMADERYEREQFAEAMALYKQYADAACGNENVITAVLFRLGFCAYRCRKYREALEWLADASFEREIGKELFKQRENLRGLCWLRTGEYDAAINVLLRASRSGEKDEIAWRANLNLAAAYIERGKEGDLPLAVDILQGFAKIPDEETITFAKGARENLITVALYNLGNAFEKSGSRPNAESAFQRAADIAACDCLPSLLSRLARMQDSEAARGNLARAVDTIINNKLNPQEADLERVLAFTKEVAVELFVAMARAEMNTECERLIDYVRAVFPEGRAAVVTLLTTAGEQAINQSVLKVAAWLFDKAMADAAQDPSSRLSILRWVVYCDQTSRWVPEYLRIVEEHREALHLLTVDIRNVSGLLAGCVRLRDWRKLLNIVKSLDFHRDKVDKQLVRNFVAFDMLRVVSFENLGQLLEARIAARRATEFLFRLPKTVEGEVLFWAKSDITSAQDIYAAAINKEILEPISPKIEKQRSRNAKVNVRYQDGRIVRGIRLKHVEKDIAAGLCSIC
jgi:tetratricopeptide (TPR) repeat protein